MLGQRVRTKWQFVLNHTQSWEDGGIGSERLGKSNFEIMDGNVLLTFPGSLNFSIFLILFFFSVKTCFGNIMCPISFFSNTHNIG